MEVSKLPVLQIGTELETPWGKDRMNSWSGKDSVEAARIEPFSSFPSLNQLRDAFLIKLQKH